MAPVKTSEH